MTPRSGPNLDQVRERLKQKLGACIQTGNITLSSGKQTDFYFDGRLVSLDPEGAVLIAELMLEELRKSGIGAVGGMTSGADPITSSIGVLAYQRQLPLKLFYVRKAAKGHGMKRQVEGPPLPRGVRAAIVDDVITTGESLLGAREALRVEYGVDASEALVVIDREEGGREKLEAEGMALAALFRRRDFLP